MERRLGQPSLRDTRGTADLRDEARGDDAVRKPATLVRNRRRDCPRVRRSSRRTATLLVELAGFLLQAFEHLQCLVALLDCAQPAVHACQHVVVRGRSRIRRDRPVQGDDGVLELTLTLVRPALLEPGSIRVGIELHRLVRVLQGFRRVADRL